MGWKGRAYTSRQSEQGGGDFVWAVVFVGLLWAIVTLWWR